jgi:hypothetical protein
MFAVLATPSLVHAQTVPSGAACSDQARHGLSNLGAWAEAQCAADQTLAFAPAFAQRCADQALQGLHRVGSWAELQCEVGG